MTHGLLLCRLADLDATGAKGITLGTWPNVRDLVIVRDGDQIRAYENSCPHLSASLEIMPDRFLDAERRHLICTTHGARFRVEDGWCVSGPCQGDTLTAVAIHRIGEAIHLGPADPP